MLRLGDVGQVEAYFGLFGDRSQDRHMVYAKCTMGM
jgi:hypothetical protein